MCRSIVLYVPLRNNAAETMETPWTHVLSDRGQLRTGDLLLALRNLSTHLKGNKGSFSSLKNSFRAPVRVWISHCSSARLWSSSVKAHTVTLLLALHSSTQTNYVERLLLSDMVWSSRHCKKSLETKQNNTNTKQNLSKITHNKHVCGIQQSSITCIHTHTRAHTHVHARMHTQSVNLNERFLVCLDTFLFIKLKACPFTQYTDEHACDIDPKVHKKQNKHNKHKKQNNTQAKPPETKHTNHNDNRKKRKKWAESVLTFVNYISKSLDFSQVSTNTIQAIMFQTCTHTHTHTHTQAHTHTHTCTHKIISSTGLIPIFSRKTT